MRTIAEGTLAYSIADIGIKIVSFFSYFLIIKALDLHDYGIVVLLISLVAPTSSIVNLGLSRVFVAEMSAMRGIQKFAQMKGLLLSYVRLVSILSTVIFVCVFFGRYIATQYFDVYLLKYFWPVLLFTFSQIVLNIILLINESFEKFKLSSVVGFSESIFRSLAIIYLFFFGTMSIPAVIFAYFFGKIFASLIGLPFVVIFVRKLWSKTKEIESGVLSGILRAHGKWEMVKVIFNGAAGSLRLWILKFIVNAQSVAIYDFANKFYSLVVALLPLRSVLFPIINRASGEESLVSLIISKAKKFLLLYYGVAYIGILILAPVFVGHFFVQYSAWMLIIYLVSLRLFLDVGTLGQTPLFYAYKKQRAAFIISFSSSVIQLILDVIFIYYFQVVGMVISLLLLTFLVILAKEYYLRKYVKVRTWNLRALFTFDSYDRIILNKILSRLKNYLPSRP
jgi:O-antigen/teichoic acid export membrane protein